MQKTTLVEKKYLIPFILITTLFALWGFANDITNPLVAAFQTLMEISAAKAALVQFAFYGGYATMAIPAALFIRKYSYKKAILLGLALYAIGAFLFIPAAAYQQFSYFCISLYILTFGLAFLDADREIEAQAGASIATIFECAGEADFRAREQAVLATLLAALWTAKVKNKWIAPLPPVICNMVIIGAMIAWYEVGFTAAFSGVFAVNALWVGLGEALVCYILGMLLIRELPKVSYLRKFMPEGVAAPARNAGTI